MSGYQEFKKKFNTTGVCISEKHYMADMSQKIKAVKRLIDNGDYFTINRPRQYGKTTFLHLIQQELKISHNYLPIKISFEGFGSEILQSEALFIRAFIESVYDVYYINSFLSRWFKSFYMMTEKVITMKDLERWISYFVKRTGKKVVLLIDEVDKISNNQLFMDFLSVLRVKYLNAAEGTGKTFHSVILSGVHDVKSMKSRIRPDNEIKYNSPWNIAVDFNIDLSFQPNEIKHMLIEYAKDRGVDMDSELISKAIHDYTSGYPFLVSSLCQIVDNKLANKNKTWELKNIEQAVCHILEVQNTNFESLVKNIQNSSELYEILHAIILNGVDMKFNIDNPHIYNGVLYGVLKNDSGRVKIHNRIYSERIYNYMTSLMETQMNEFSNSGIQYTDAKGHLDMEKVLTQFQLFMKSQYSKHDKEFLERNGRLIFLAFIKPIINGNGYDFKEVQISEEKRLDVVITYNNQKYVVEMKKWYGPKAHEKGLIQLTEYLNHLSLNVGYLLIFDFRKKTKKFKTEKQIFQNKEICAIWV